MMWEERTCRERKGMMAGAGMHGWLEGGAGGARGEGGRREGGGDILYRRSMCDAHPPAVIPFRPYSSVATPAIACAFATATVCFAASGRTVLPPQPVPLALALLPGRSVPGQQLRHRAAAEGGA